MRTGWTRAERAGAAPHVRARASSHTRWPVPSPRALGSWIARRALQRLAILEPRWDRRTERSPIKAAVWAHVVRHMERWASHGRPEPPHCTLRDPGRRRGRCRAVQGGDVGGAGAVPRVKAVPWPCRRGAPGEGSAGAVPGRYPGECSAGTVQAGLAEAAAARPDRSDRVHARLTTQPPNGYRPEHRCAPSIALPARHDQPRRLTTRALRVVPGEQRSQTSAFFVPLPDPEDGDSAEGTDQRCSW
jgi:hypothetical protein